MTREQFAEALDADSPPEMLTDPIAALWWDAKGDWAKAHSLVDNLESPEAMAVHAYLHRKEGEQWNADYWYERAGKNFYRSDLAEEWKALVDALLPR